MLKNALLAFSLIMLPIASQAADPDESVKTRQELFKQMGGEMKKLGGLVKGDVNASRADITESAAKIAALSTQPWPYFGQETSVTRLNNEAGPAIWSDPAGFRTSQEKFILAAQTLNSQAAKADQATLQKLVGDLGATCGACHKAYKED